ncbi:pectate lyase superfamily protein-domain-containing protein [Nemania sp. NC0429]|nr:pectate lyase superfamily protein-domain-containing protein [Nemania sp. NC0429]
MPFAPSEYQFFRNVKDFGAVGDGVTDDTAAINRAVVAMSSSNLTPARCGETCASTSTLGALVYFPYYYTQFVGDVNNRPTIKGAKDFAGIALIDTDVYIPGGGGDEWYINQSQFYRQIRNFIFDLTAMNRTNHDLANSYVATGIHWQVGQATSLQNLHFEMPLSDADGAVTHVGIFMENGSGGFLSDLTFYGGAIGFRAGTQQYTARNLSFTLCLTAVSSIWNWGFTWKNIYVRAVYIAIDCTNVGGLDTQGTGSVTVLDSHFDGVPYPITLRAGGPYPNIVLDNLLVENSASIVLISGGETILPGSSGQLYFDSWGMGGRYSSIDGHADPGGSGGFVTGFISPSVVKPAVLLDDAGKIFERSKPQYENLASGGFLVATEFGIANDGTGDQSTAINNLLIGAAGTPVFFPAGIYQVQNTVRIPLGSIIVGEGWSQIMGSGSFFEDQTNPQVMVQVGNDGDYGSVEISDMLFTGSGPTAGMILMEWNVRAESQGSAGMWDSHFRVGGARGSNLQSGDCPILSGVNPDCIAAFMLLHVTASGNGYFENVWAWVADHDLDDDRNAQATEGLDGVPRNVLTQVSIYAARGVLIESSGPCWFYGTSSEHSMFYQYQLQGASNIYLGHMQTETPYFQPDPGSTEVYQPGQLPGDPTWDDCDPGTTCEEAFALRIVNSSSILIYGAGFYNFFNNYDQTCVADENCQERLIQIDCTYKLWMYNIWTKGSVEVISPEGLPPALQANAQSGYTTEISAWLVLAGDGSSICSSGSGGGSGVVYIDPIIFVEPDPVVACSPPCTFVFPTSPLPAATIITPPPFELPVDGTTTTTLTPAPSMF